MDDTRVTPGPPASALLSVPEAAEYARVSRMHMYRLVKRGEVEAVRVGEGHGPIRLPADSFMRWLYGEPKGTA